MKKIGLFGGSFDPFTKAHMSIVETVLSKNLVDMVVILPTIVDYHREGKSKWLNDTQKFEVMYQFIVDSPFKDRIMMDFREIRMKNSGQLTDEQVKKWRFIDTLERCQKLYEGFELYTIVGTDSLRNFKTWYRWNDIVSKSKLIGILGRNDETVDIDIDFIPISIPSEFSAISSSEIRSKYDNVYDYIRDIQNKGE